MQEIIYKYTTRKNKIAALVLNIVGAVLALIASGAMIVVSGSLSSAVISYGAFIVGYYGQILAIVAFVAVGFLSCFALKKSTRLTLPALIVTLVVYVIFTALITLNTVISTQYVVETLNYGLGWQEIAIYAGLLLLTVVGAVAWILFIVGHSEINRGVRNNKMIQAGFWLLIATMIALFAVQITTNVFNIINVDGYLVSTQYGVAMDSRLPVLLTFVAFGAGYLAILCVAIAYYLLSRSEMTEIVVEIPVITIGTDPSVTLDGYFRQNIALNTFLTVITLGIYGFVWFYRNAKRLRQLCGQSTNGCVDELLLCILGGPIYRAYWYYTRSQQLNDTVKALGYEDIFLSPKMYLVLAILTPGVFQLAYLTANYNKLFNVAGGFEETDPVIIREPLESRYSLLKVVLLSLVTLGVYYVVTIVRLTNKTRALQGKVGVDNVQIACLVFVPFYWVYWLISRDEKYHEGTNEATLEAWMLLVVPMYSIFWLITRMADLKKSAEKLGVSIASESIWSFLFAILTPFVAYANMLSDFNKVSESIIRAEVLEIRSGSNVVADSVDNVGDSVDVSGEND